MLADRGRMLGKYQLIAEIARGGMGVVYLAMIQGPGKFNKLVVVKELKPEMVEEPAFLTMFLDEARLAARLSHPNIVQTNEVGNDGDRYFMAMDYLDGRGLDQVRRRARTAGFGLSAPMQLRVLCEMLAGLDYAHALTDFDGSPLNIVHRDVSPQNVFLTFDGQIKLLDFGIAKAADSMHETHAGVLKGKVSYMSPEQARGHKVDARADVFSAGIMLWEALTGQRLREGKNDQEKLWALVSADVPRASSVKPWVPPELDEICARAMAWDRDERYPTAGALQQDLERYLAVTGTNVTARDVGACVTEMFREDRATTQGVIEAHVARARGASSRDAIPIIDVSSRSRSGLGPTPSDERRVADSRSAPGLDSPGAESADLASAAPSGTSKAARLRSLRPLLVAAGAGAVAVVVIIVLIAQLARPADDTSPSAASDPRTSATASLVRRSAEATVAPARPPRPLVDVAIRVSPETAQISIDGRAVATNPFAGRYVSDDVVHHVQAIAPGYLAKSLKLPFNANVTLDLSLEREPSPSVTPPPPSRTAGPSRPSSRPTAPSRPPPAPRNAEVAHPSEPARAPEPLPVRPALVEPVAPSETKPAVMPTEVDPAGGSKPRRPIDPNNPYGDRE